MANDDLGHQHNKIVEFINKSSKEIECDCPYSFANSHNEFLKVKNF